MPVLSKNRREKCNLFNNYCFKFENTYKAFQGYMLYKANIKC